MKQSIREQLDRKQAELEGGNMKEQEIMAPADLAEVLRQTAELNRVILEEKAVEAQERKAKREEEAAKRIELAAQQAESARQKADLDRRKREFCLHSMVHPATKQRKTSWLGQVNSDGYIVPLCNLCHLEMPKIKASEDQKANGVRFAEYSTEQLTVVMFERAHKEAFPQGCDRDMCYLCHAVKFPDGCRKQECHMCNPVLEAVAV